MNWLPDMDLNHDKQIQSLLCYRYTIGQTDALERLKSLMNQSSRQTFTGLKAQRDADANPDLTLRDKGTRHGIVNRKS